VLVLHGGVRLEQAHDRKPGHTALVEGDEGDRTRVGRPRVARGSPLVDLLTVDP
jgi:hypothetical protein